MIEDESLSIKEDETESMRHAARLAERARIAAEKEKQEIEEQRKLEEASSSENPEDWLVE